MYLYRNLKLELDDDNDIIIKKLAKKIKVNARSISSFKYFKLSIDARNKEHIFFIANILFECNEKIHSSDVKILTDEEIYPIIKKEEFYSSNRPVIVGFGPSGMFAALYLARKGLKPIVLEQGYDVDTRIKDVDEFLINNKLNPKSNVVFGEGGAGTFSDGKLNTNNKDPFIRLILNEFVNHGAPEEILYDFKPHIGTDKLVNVVKNIRNEIIELGGNVIFNATFTEMIKEKNKVVGCKYIENDEAKELKTDAIFLCIGHSSFDTYKYLYENEIEMQKKPFAIGFRIQHEQEFINKAQYGKYYNHPKLKAASYKLITHLENGRSVFNFCTCPGGEVINSSCDSNGIVCNGMSNYLRNGKHCNSAILVSVKTSDIEGDCPLNGVYMLQSLEQKCYDIWHAHELTCQNVEDFMRNVETKERVEFDMKSCYKMGSLNGILPAEFEESFKQGLLNFNKIIPGFVSDKAYLFGVETRSSSPLTIIRNNTYQSPSLRGLYPCGEGAGYAGGITTSAIDGLKAAMSYRNKLKGGEL